MAIVQVLRCDLCGSEDDVVTVTVSRKGSRSFDIDLCGECWIKQLREGLGARGRTSRRVSTRQPTRVKAAPDVLPPSDDQQGEADNPTET